MECFCDFIQISENFILKTNFRIYYKRKKISMAFSLISCALQHDVTASKLVSLDQLQLNSEFNPQWVRHTFDFVPHLENHHIYFPDTFAMRI